ncbi:DUF5518 domain-containing protein [Methanoculleus sp. 10]|uniref:DUF5518 domain-containing protein n=1 Tax=Methanoculleus sp. 10 TaxID=430615 RepID=UPI0025EF2E7C|nr:DUF5518 domain-containing protein [Methanoculleus sp. 10]
MALVSGLLGLLSVVAAPLAGGFIAGYASGGRPKDGLKAGFVAALFGAGPLFFIPLLWTALHDFGFADTFEGMVAIALVYFFTLFGTAAGVAGAVVRQSFGVEEADDVGGVLTRGPITPRRICLRCCRGPYPRS